jgi:parvulin-like peptidyl-prolyl isomerase
LIKKRAPSQEVLDRQLKSMGMTMDELRKRLVEETVAETVLFNKVTITDDQVKKFYDENPSQFEQPEQVRASHILIMTKDPKTGEQLSDDDKKAKRAQIEDLLKRARAGEDFAKLAKQYSEDPGSKDNGGEYTFPRGQMMPEFEAAAFSLQTNQISDVVTTTYGYHIIKLSEKIPAHRIELAKVSNDIKDYLQKKELDKLMPQMYSQLKKEYHVEILDDDLKALEESGDTGDFGTTPTAPKPDAGTSGGGSSTNK